MSATLLFLVNRSNTTRLGTGDVKPEDDETLWWVPLEITTVQDGKTVVDHKAVLEGRETVYPLKNVANSTYKLNSGTAGVCKHMIYINYHAFKLIPMAPDRVNYTPERLTKLGEEATKDDSPFTLNDR